MTRQRTSDDEKHFHLFRHLVHGSLLAGGAWLWMTAPRFPSQRKKDAVSAFPLQGVSKKSPRLVPVPNVPYAHRGLHDAGSGLHGAHSDANAERYIALARSMARQAGYQADPDRPVAPENSLPAFAAACEAGFGIELDLQMTADQRVVVVHDSNLKRVTGVDKRVEDLTYEQLKAIPLFPAPSHVGDARSAISSHVADSNPVDSNASHSQHVPLFSDVLSLVDGRVPIIVEYKFDDGKFDPKLMEAGDALLRAYRGPYVIESFDPRAVRWYRQHRRSVCRGQLADASPLPSMQDLIASQGQSRHSFAGISLPGIDLSGVIKSAAGALLFDWAGRPDFVALDWTMGKSIQARIAKELGAVMVAWTVRSPAEEFECIDRFDRVIFEAYVPRSF
jgi:glycerophosphoryl diester phosphodiesterase